MNAAVAIYLFVIAATGLLSIVAYRIRPNKVAKTSSNVADVGTHKLLEKLLAATEANAELVRQLQVPTSSSATLQLSIVAQPKASPKTEKVRLWFLDHPNSELTSVAIAKTLGVSHTLVDKVRKEQI